MTTDESVLIHIGEGDSFIKGQIDWNKMDPSYKHDQKYNLQGTVQSYFVITKRPDSYKILPSESVKLTLHYSLPDMSSIVPSQIHPLFDSSRSIFDSISIDIKESNRFVDVQLCIPPSGKIHTTTLYSTFFPLCCIPKDSIPILQSLNTIPLYTSISVILQSFSPPTSNRLFALFPKELRYAESGKLFFYPVFNCKQLGGIHSCLLEIQAVALPIAYYAFYFTHSTISAYFAILSPTSYIQEQVNPSTYSEWIRFFEQSPQTRSLSYNLCSLIGYSANTPSVPFLLSSAITVPIKLLRGMGETAEVRLMESISVRFGESAKLPPLSKNEIIDQVACLRHIGAIHAIPDFETSIEECLQTFQNYGGTIVIQPTDPAAPKIPVGIKPSDIILSVCHEGWNRSQTLLQSIKSIKRCFVLSSDNESSIACHGALSGFDPNKLFYGFSEKEQFQYIHSTFDEDDPTAIAFRRIFGEEKQKRLGDTVANDLAINWREAPDSVVLSNRQFLYNYFSQVIWTVDNKQWCYSQLPRTGRILLLCFYKSFSVVLQRLIENCSFEENCFENVILVCLPYSDPISQIALTDVSMIENAYRVCFEWYLKNFVFVELSTDQWTQCLSSTQLYSLSNKESLLLYTTTSGVSSALTVNSTRWFVGRVVRGSKTRRRQIRDYSQFVVHRLSTFGWPSVIHQHSILQNQLIFDETVDIILYGPIIKEDLQQVHFDELNASEIRIILKEIIKELTVFHEAGIVYNNLFYDNIFRYQNHICLFDTVQAIVDPHRNANVIQSDGYPFFHLLGNENLLRFPESVFNHFWKKSGDPSVSNDSFLLGVIWWIVDPPKRGFIEQKLLCEAQNRELPSALLSLV